jgi:uncharacterized protein (DUF58 family)
MATGKKYIGDLFISMSWYLLSFTAAVLFLASYFLPFLFAFAVLFAVILGGATLLDYLFLFSGRGTISGERRMPQRFSLGDENPVHISLLNTYPFNVRLRIIDELPVQFQDRDFALDTRIRFRKKEQIHYILRPLSRGVFSFGRLICYTRSPLGLLQRRIVPAGPDTVKVYPAFQQLRKYQLLAQTDSLISGNKKIRRLGHSMEFENIKDYVTGDDIRSINWKATARRNAMMVNTYTDARQQQIYCVIDKGRSMKMPFEGLSLLDYAINASLALLHVVLMKQDKAGLVCFTGEDAEIIPADRRNNQFLHLQEALYRQETDFRESDYSSLRTRLYRGLGQRSFLLLFTNFETVTAMERQLPYLRQLARQHLLCIVFFENTQLKQIHEQQPDNIKGIYIKTIADRFDYEKKQIVRELRRHGILSILSTPSKLSVDVINKYLELKSRQMV